MASVSGKETRLGVVDADHQLRRRFKFRREGGDDPKGLGFVGIKVPFDLELNRRGPLFFSGGGNGDREAEQQARWRRWRRVENLLGAGRDKAAPIVKP